MVAELERRAREIDPAMTAIDYVCERTAAGDTFRAICRDLVDAIGHSLEGGTLSSWVNGNADYRMKITAARALGATNLVEEGMEILDDADESREAVAKAKARADYRQWLASKWNRPQYGQDQAQVNVQVNMGSLLLDSLRRRQVTAKADARLTADNSTNGTAL